MLPSGQSAGPHKEPILFILEHENFVVTACTQHICLWDITKVKIVLFISEFTTAGCPTNHVISLFSLKLLFTFFQDHPKGVFRSSGITVLPSAHKDPITAIISKSNILCSGDSLGNLAFWQVFFRVKKQKKLTL